MALSNWALAAINEEGKATNGRILSPSGVLVELRKNWLSVRHEAAYVKEGSYFEAPIVMLIESGELYYHDLQIRAIRGLQDGIYFVVGHRGGGLMIGCGVSAYEDDKLIGVGIAAHMTLVCFARQVAADFEDVHSALSKAQWLQANQGDLYFEKELELGEAGTPIGEAPPEPMIQKFIRGFVADETVRSMSTDEEGDQEQEDTPQSPE